VLLAQVKIDKTLFRQDALYCKVFLANLSSLAL